MKNKTMRIFIVDGKEMQFNLTFFNNIFKNKAKHDKKGIGELEEELATVLFVEKSTVHAWRNRINGPSDIDKVEQIAKFFNLDKKDFLIEVEEMINSVNECTKDAQEMITINFGYAEKESFKRVYKAMLNFMNMRIKYDKSLNDAAEEYFMEQIAYEALSEEEQQLEENFQYEIATLDAYVGGAAIDWENVDFNKELEKVESILEEEIVDLPKEIYMLFELYVTWLEKTIDESIQFIHREEISYEDEGYWGEYLSNVYVKNEKIISTIKENIRTLIFKLKS